VISERIPLHREKRLVIVQQMKVEPLMLRRPNREIPSLVSKRSSPQWGGQHRVLGHIAAAFIGPPTRLRAK
jgi:hypothetical protein